jgi:hypothetical protein
MNVMKKLIQIALVSCFCLTFVPATLALAGAGNDTVDKDLVNRHQDFERFALKKVAQLNRNHRLSPSRMQISKQADGSYRARYHKIDDSSLAVKVNRSSSQKIPYVGIVSYREQVYEASAESPEQCKKAQFTVKEVIPNRQIFSYKKGKWY